MMTGCNPQQGRVSACSQELEVSITHRGRLRCRRAEDAAITKREVIVNDFAIGSLDVAIEAQACHSSVRSLSTMRELVSRSALILPVAHP